MNDGPCSVCGRYQNRPCVVDGIVVNDKREILLIRRGREPHKGTYAIPGGFIDWNETAKEAVVRELFEETGLDVDVVSFVGYFDALKRDAERHTVTLVFLCKDSGTSSLRAGDDADECRWFSLDSLPQLAFDHAEIIFQCLKNYKRSE